MAQATQAHGFLAKTAIDIEMITVRVSARPEYLWCRIQELGVRRETVPEYRRSRAHFAAPETSQVVPAAQSGTMPHGTYAFIKLAQGADKTAVQSQLA
jgi:hypothetical protein